MMPPATIGTGANRPALLLAGVLAMSLGGCTLPRHYLYSPDNRTPMPAVWARTAPQSMTVRTADDLSLAGSFWPSASGDPDIYVFFHGRNWNRARAADAAQYLTGAGNAVLVASYRGFAGNPGSASETGLLIDAAAFIARARELAGPDARIWLVGHSIGAAVALHAAAADGHVAGVIALSPFATMTQAVPRPWRAFVPDNWDNLDAIGRISAPIVILQGLRDRFVPADHGDRLFSAYHGPEALVAGVDSRHNPDMRLLAPWINAAIVAMQQGSLETLPTPPAGWVEKVRRP